MATPLTNLLAKMVRKPLPCTEDCETAFRTLKKRVLRSRSVLEIPDLTQCFLAQVDASAKNIGAVLAQGTTGAEKPMVFLKLLSRNKIFNH